MLIISRDVRAVRDRYYQMLPTSGREDRVYHTPELRVDDSEGGPRISGYAAVFDTLSVPIWDFRERIEPGAFAKTIREADVRSLWNHDTNLVLGRTKNRTLRLWEDETGLGDEIFPPDTQWGRDAVVSIQRGDVDQQSFGFEAVRDEWHSIDGETIRTLIECKLFDVSPATFPAYPDTSVGLRSLLGLDPQDVDLALRRLAMGTMTRADRQLLGAFIETLESRLESAPGQEPHPDEPDDTETGDPVPAAPGQPPHPAEAGDDESARAAQLSLLRRQLDLAEAE